MATATPATPKLILDDVSLRRMLMDLQMRFTFSVIPYSDDPQADMDYLIRVMETNPLAFSSYLPAFNSENN